MPLESDIKMILAFFSWTRRHFCEVDSKIAGRGFLVSRREFAPSTVEWFLTVRPGWQTTPKKQSPWKPWRCTSRAVRDSTWATIMSEILRTERKTNVAHLSDVALLPRALASQGKEINFTWTRKHTQIRDGVSRAFYLRLKYRRASLRRTVSDLCESKKLFVFV